MKALHLFAIVGTARDWRERIVAVAKRKSNAQAIAQRYALAHCPTRFVRFIVRPVALTPAELQSLAESWGRADAEAGEERSEAARLPEPYRTAYLRGWDAGKTQARH